MLSTHFCILLPKSNWSLLLSCGPARLSVPARGGLLFLKTVHAQANWMLLTLCVGISDGKDRATPLSPAGPQDNNKDQFDFGSKMQK